LTPFAPTFRFRIHMPEPPLHTSFESVELRHEVAHGGRTPILTRRVWRPDQVPACNFVDLTVVPAGAEIGIHTHDTDNEEIYVVISGRAEMHVDGETIEVGPGHVVVNRPGGTHALRNPGPEEVRLVVIEVPLAERA
jgi:mannose-6-phosphate isomerase-like protein (cupin superfamily)